MGELKAHDILSIWPNAYLKHSLLIGLFSTGNQSNSYTDLYTVYMYVTGYGKSRTMVHNTFDKMDRFMFVI